jgi:hypothetical protein
MLSGYSGLGGCHSRILDRWTATQAAPKAPQRKRPCRSRALSLILAVRSLKLRVREPRQGLVAFSLTDQAPVRCSAPCAECSCARGTPVATGYRAPHWQAGLNASLARRCQTRRRLGPAGHNPHAHSRHPRDCRAGPPIFRRYLHGHWPWPGLAPLGGVTSGSSFRPRGRWSLRPGHSKP